MARLFSVYARGQIYPDLLTCDVALRSNRHLLWGQACRLNILVELDRFIQVQDGQVVLQEAGIVCGITVDLAYFDVDLWTFAYFPVVFTHPE